MRRTRGFGQPYLSQRSTPYRSHSSIESWTQGSLFVPGRRRKKKKRVRKGKLLGPACCAANPNVTFPHDAVVHDGHWRLACGATGGGKRPAKRAEVCESSKWDLVRCLPGNHELEMRNKLGLSALEARRSFRTMNSR
ncbi:hypothetical protein CaCOL14_007336 [Colletotrichum acutatum]